MRHTVFALILLFMSAACGAPSHPHKQEVCEQDADCDGLFEWEDNCRWAPNPDQTNSDTDQMGDACDPCDLDPGNDIDQDGDCGDVDNCPGTHNPDQLNTDADGFGDVCDQTPTGDPHAATIADHESRLDVLEGN